MQTLNLYWFHQFGRSLGGLTTTAATDSHKLNEWRWSSQLEGTRSWLIAFSAMDTKILPKTQAAAKVLVGIIDKFKPLLAEDRVAQYDEWRTITDGIVRFDNVYEQELEDNHAFVVTPLGAYSTSALVYNASIHLSDLAQNRLDDKVKLDYNEAGACLALDFYTASGFHAMRALEATARSYHMVVTDSAEALMDVPLGPLINGSRDVTGLRDQWVAEGSPNDSPLGLIISMLLQINKIYRSPIMHPEMTLDKEEAKHLFDTAAIAISAMVADHEFRKAVKEARAKSDAAASS